MTALIDDFTISAIDGFADGQPALLLWDEGGKDTPAEIIVAAEHASTAALAFMVRYGSGLIRVAMTDDDADRLDLPSMYLPGTRDRDARDTVAVDAREGVTTGISASDRACTIRMLGSADTTPEDLIRPGHVIPMRVALSTTTVVSLPAAALRLARAARLRPVVAMCSLVSDENPSRMATVGEGEEFARQHKMPIFYSSRLDAGDSGRC